MVQLSFWERQSFFSDIDIAIIGSGIVGLTTAIYIKRANPALRVVVFERGTLPVGASTRNAGFACFGSMTELLEDLTTNGEDEVFSLVESRWKGLLNLRQLIGDQALQYRPFGGFEIFKKEELDLFEKCADSMAYFNRMLAPIIGSPAVFELASDRVKTFRFQGISHIIHNREEGQINTGEMMKSLIDLAEKHDVRTFYGIAIKSLEETSGKVCLTTDQGWEIMAGKALVATNGFARHLLPGLEVTPARNQVLITKPVDNLPFKGAFHYDRGYFYFRSVEERGRPGTHRILLGGGRNLSPETETTDEFGQTSLIKNALTDLLENVIYPNKKVEIDSWWSGILGVGGKKKPILEMTSDQIGVAVRLGGMGVAIGSQIGREAARMITE